MATAADLSSLYEPSTLQYWGDRYQRSTTKILDEVIWPALLSNEKRQLGRKPVLEFPLPAQSEDRELPFAFHARLDRGSIVLPVFSLKFLDDLCTAYAWLQVNGYSLETVSEYTAILKYGKAPPTGFPPPLRALRIPENALENPRVDELALGHFVTARTFILLHEVGHLLDRHIAHRRESVRNEQEADRFAAGVMQRTPLPPLGILVFFLADAHWSGFPANGRHTHPLSGERVRALANHVEDRGLAAQLRLLGESLDDPEIRAGFVATGRAGDLAALAPRRARELPRRAVESRLVARQALFDGVHRGELVQFLEPGAIAVELVLARREDYVRGHYTFGLGFGTIEGHVKGQQLHFEWQWAGNYGHGILEGRDDGSFTGTWGYREARSGAGTWIGKLDSR